MTISCIIIDDEPNALSLLEEYAGRVSLFIIKGKFYDALEALEFLKKNKIDVIFTDINMPMLNGLELADILPPDQKFVFTTAFSEYALNSFSYHVIDYLLKPISFKRFIQACEKIKAMVATGLNPDATTTSDKNIIFVKSGKQVIKVDLRQVLYIKGEKEYVSFHFKNERLLSYKRMHEMEKILPSNFARIHVSYIVNLNHIIKMEANHIWIADAMIPVTRNYRAAFIRYLGLNMI